MTRGITVRFLGDSGPFSRMGKSIGYQVTVGQTSFLIDCGAPLFQQIGGHGLKNIMGLIVTHCHDDHKRWFTDLSLFSRYAPDIGHKTFLMTSEDVYSELLRASSPALDRSLTPDSRLVSDMSCEDFVEYRMLGPKAKYRIAEIAEGNGRYRLSVLDRQGKPVGPDRAKIVISSRTGRRRLLFRDPSSNEWVEPESFYPFTSQVFYEVEQNDYEDPSGFVIEAVKAPVWHGISAIGIRVRTDNEVVTFSSDTHHDTELWKSLCEERHQQRHAMEPAAFDAAGILHGDINDYIERVWSVERYNEAICAFDNGISIHDISVRKSVVHTDYEKLSKTSLSKERVILTHSPDTITSTWVLGDTEKVFRIAGTTFSEVVGDRLYRMDADIYHKEAGRYFVGYRNSKGTRRVYEKSGLHGLASENDAMPDGAKELFRVDLYEDIGGEYYPVLDGDERYKKRPDDRVERIIYSHEGSSGKVVESRERTPL